MDGEASTLYGMTIKVGINGFGRIGRNIYRAATELNLSELATQMNLSKSAVNHRLRRLVEISEGVPEVSRTAN